LEGERAGLEADALDISMRYDGSVEVPEVEEQAAEILKLKADLYETNPNPHPNTNPKPNPKADLYETNPNPHPNTNPKPNPKADLYEAKQQQDELKMSNGKGKGNSRGDGFESDAQRQLAKLLDKNQDGLISREEVVSALSGISGEESETSAIQQVAQELKRLSQAQEELSARVSGSINASEEVPEDPISAVLHTQKLLEKQGLALRGELNVLSSILTPTIEKKAEPDLFDMIDRNGDGKFTREEFMSAFDTSKRLVQWASEATGGNSGSGSSMPMARDLHTLVQVHSRPGFN